MQIIGCKLKSQREIQRIQARANTQTGAAAVQMNLPTFRTSANILSDEQVEEKNKSCGAGCPTLCVSNKLFPFFFFPANLRGQGSITFDLSSQQSFPIGWDTSQSPQLGSLSVHCTGSGWYSQSHTCVRTSRTK